MRKLLPGLLLLAASGIALGAILRGSRARPDYVLTVIPAVLTAWFFIVSGMIAFFSFTNARYRKLNLLIHLLFALALALLPFIPNIANRQISPGVPWLTLTPLVLLMPFGLLLGKFYAERRQSRWHLIQTEKMAAMGSLLAGLAHEINNPLTFIYSNIDIVREYLGSLQAALPEQNDKIQKIFSQLNATIDTMDEGATRAQEIVKNLRHFAYPGKQDKEWVDLESLLDHSIALLAPKWKGRLRIMRRYSQIPKIRAFSGELSQVFLNVLANACDATPKRGAIKVRTWRDGDSVTVSVRDSGIGISKQDLPRIFNPFFTTKQQGEGTGLGLAISQQLVQKHRGKIEVHSEHGKGADFRITFPIEALPLAREMEDAEEAAIPARREI